MGAYFLVQCNLAPGIQLASARTGSVQLSYQGGVRPKLFEHLRSVYRVFRKQHHHAEMSRANPALQYCCNEVSCCLYTSTSAHTAVYQVSGTRYHFSFSLSICMLCFCFLFDGFLSFLYFIECGCRACRVVS